MLHVERASLRGSPFIGESFGVVPDGGRQASCTYISPPLAAPVIRLLPGRATRWRRATNTDAVAAGVSVLDGEPLLSKPRLASDSRRDAEPEPVNHQPKLPHREDSFWADGIVQSRQPKNEGRNGDAHHRQPLGQPKDLYVFRTGRFIARPAPGPTSKRRHYEAPGVLRPRQPARRPESSMQTPSPVGTGFKRTSRSQFRGPAFAPPAQQTGAGDLGPPGAACATHSAEWLSRS